MSGTGLSEGDFVLISSNVEDEDNAKLYVWNGSDFNFISDLSGTQGIKGERGPQGVKGDTGAKGPKGDAEAVDYSKTVNTTGDQTVAGEKTFSNKLTVNGIIQADWFYKHLKKGTMSASIMEVLDDNLDGRQYSVGKYYSSNTYGNGVAITGYGLTGIGGGESITALFDKIQVGDIDTTAMPLVNLGDESLVLASDSFIYLFPGQQKAPNYNGNWRFSDSGYIDRYDTASKKWVNIIGNNTGVLAQDSQVVHNTGNETVAGNKTFSGNTTIGGTLMTDSGWKNMSLASGVKATVARYRLLNGVVYIQVLDVTADVGKVFATLPAGYRPPHWIWESWFSANKSGNFLIGDNGEVSRASSTTSGTDSGTKASFEVSYPID